MNDQDNRPSKTSRRLIQADLIQADQFNRAFDEPNTSNTVVSQYGFGLYGSPVAGPTGQVVGNSDGWTWTVTGTCETQERAVKEMRNAIEGASIIDGRDRQGRLVLPE